MNDSIEEKRRFASLITALADYYDKELSKAVIGLYWEGLKQYDFEAIEKAAWAHTQNPDEAGRWMPKVSDLNKVLQGSSGDQSQIAWAKVDAAIRRIGPYQDVVFDDPIIHRVIADMGGWVELSRKDNEAWPFVAREFETRYRGHRMRTEAMPYPKRLMGIASTHNSEAGIQHTARPVLIGDQQKALSVLQGGSDKPLLEMAPASALMIGNNLGEER